MKLSVIIVSYNVKDLLLQCLRSVFVSAGSGKCEVIVVDNHSTDDSVASIRKEFPQVSMIANEHNAGFSEANNQGMRISTGEFILLLNPDTEFRNGTLSSLLAFCETHKNKFLLGPRLLNSDGTLQISAWKKQGTWNVIAESLFLHKLLHVSEYSADKFNTQFSPWMVSGAAMLFPRIVFEETNGMDPHLFWMEDADLSHRAAKSGAEIIYFPSAEIIHHSGQSSKKNLNVTISNQLLSKLKFIRKHDGLFLFCVAVCFVKLQIFSRLIIFGIAGLFSTTASAKAKAYAYSFRKFYRYLFSGDKRVT
ncbi:MAG TPA: glycosyltransferase family 2 protein [Bacteroidia bacterium]|jgi:GT2 family glycosyltransferase|nr:glycosyltransferase family 2 protein [Bacteroidia bacterium]